MSRAVASFAFTASALFAVSNAAQQPRYSEKIEVRLVQIDVIVTDRSGNRVHGLTADDFDVLEGRKPQQLTNFTEYRATAAETSTACRRPS